MAILCENMCEEGSESKFGSEEGMNNFCTLWMHILFKKEKGL